jgi:hypothetical protein
VLKYLPVPAALRELSLAALTSAPWPWVSCALRAVAMALGLILIALASMTYEDEEGRLQNGIRKLQNRVENWWIKIDDRRKASMPWVALFMREVAKLVGRCFDKVLTKRLLSMRLVGVSLLLSMASALFSILVLPPILHSPPVPSFGGGVLTLLWLAVMTIIPAFSESASMPLKPWLPRMMRFLWWVAIIRIILTVTDFLLVLSRSGAPGAFLAANIAIILPFIFGISAGCDLSYILFTRWTLRRISATDTLGGILLWILLLLLFLASIVIALPIIGLSMMKYSTLVGGVLLFSVFMNSIDVVILLASLLVAVLLLLHRLVWPLVQRPLYAIQRIQLANGKEWKRRKRLLWGVGVCLIVTAVPGFPSSALHFLEKFLM